MSYNSQDNNYPSPIQSDSVWNPGFMQPRLPEQVTPRSRFDSIDKYYESKISPGSYANQPEISHDPTAHSYLGDPIITNAAMHYGTKLVGTGKEIVDKEIEKYVALTKLKYYFSVDTMYVLQKLKLLLFPFVHHDWSLKYSQNMPLQPRYDINAPDLYIPAMAYVTYVLVAGLVLGTQNQFSPEVLGILASQALAWIVVEVLIQQITLYVTSMQSNVKSLDLLAFAGYKFIGIILSVLMSLLLGKEGYYVSLLYTSFSLAFFLVRALKFQLLAEKDPSTLDDGFNSPSKSVYGNNNKRRMYFVLSVAVCQPVLMWWLSCHLVSS